MVACVERRFGISKAAHIVEWLSDNGSAYIAKDTLEIATLGRFNLKGGQKRKSRLIDRDQSYCPEEETVRIAKTNSSARVFS